jgi:hypothetical protein
MLVRALLRLKPSRICESMGHYERYAMPQLCINALRARLLGGERGRNAVFESGVDAPLARLRSPLPLMRAGRCAGSRPGAPAASPPESCNWPRKRPALRPPVPPLKLLTAGRPQPAALESPLSTARYSPVS